MCNVNFSKMLLLVNMFVYSFEETARAIKIFQLKDLLQFLFVDGLTNLNINRQE